ncbi:MAG: hypothetical protein IJS08_17095 [Victivallales bacterium]|nr:hypothetical protein [Victivallales bacterium]
MMKVIDEQGRLLYGKTRLSWEIAFGNKKDPVQILDPSQMFNFKMQDKDGVLKLEWKGCQLIGSQFTVTVCWKPYGEGWQGTIEYNLNTQKLYVEEVRFPVVSMPFPKDIVHLLVGNEQGWIYSFKEDAPDGKLLLQNYNSMFLTLAMTDDGNCLYIDHRDGKHTMKMFNWEKENGRLIYRGIEQMPCDSKTRKAFAVPYPSTVINYQGTWYDAAQIYRKWAIQQPAYLKRIRRNRMRDIAMWLWNRGAIDNVVPPAIKLQKDAGVPVALDWYWWHGNPYDTDYPHYWPPREGVEAFTKAVQRLNEEKLYTQVYVNGVAWDVESPSFEKDKGKDALIVNRDGTPRAIMYNCYTKRKLGSCCGEAEVFQEKIRDIVKKLTACGLPGVYLDMIGMSLQHPCYNKAHKHSPGGGNYNYKGYRKYVKKIREENPGIVLSTESLNENFLDLFESFIVLSTSMERCGAQDWIDAVPMFSAIYHGACAMFGSFALPDGIPCWDPLWPPKEKWKNEQDWNQVFPDQFYAEVARTIVWGMQPTVCNFRMCHTEGVFAPLYDYMIRIARFYHENRDFLYDGQMLNPGELKCQQVEVSFLHRATFTTEEKSTVRKRMLPAIMHSCWKAPSTKEALVMVNYTSQEQTCEFQGKSYTLPARTPMLVILKNF